jgi:ferrochelatase
VVNVTRRDPPHSGVLIANLGSPSEPSVSAVRRFLAEFLWDPRVVEMPRWLWWPVLHGVILRVRPRRSARAYRSIWTENGSPLIAIGRRQVDALQRGFDARSDGVRVELGMRYGEPSIAAALESLREAGVERLLVIPLYPQYSATTTGSVFDAVTDLLKTWRWIPELHLVNGYHDDPRYIRALASTIDRQRPPGRLLLMSFHGIPVRYAEAGDPYPEQCEHTARLLAAELGLHSEQWRLCFQSRFGREPWLSPYIDEVLRSLPRDGLKDVDVVCPGFAADCLETLEEIDQRNREQFLTAGGESFHYVPCLNDDSMHIDALIAIANDRLRR